MAFPTTSEVNRQFPLLPSKAYTTTQTSGDKTNGGFRGCQLVIDVTAYTSGGITPKIEGKDPTSGKYYQLHANFTDIQATGTKVYEVYPSAGAAAGGITAIGAHNLPRVFKVTLTVDDATPITYSASLNMLI